MCKTNNTVCTITLGFSLLWLWIDQKLWIDEKLYISIKTSLLVLAEMALLKSFRQINFESRCPLSSAAFRKVENFEFPFDLLPRSFPAPSKHSLQLFSTFFFPHSAHHQHLWMWKIKHKFNKKQMRWPIQVKYIYLTINAGHKSTGHEEWQTLSKESSICFKGLSLPPPNSTNKQTSEANSFFLGS